MEQFDYQSFLTYHGTDYADFVNHYTEPDEDEYSTEDIAVAQEGAQTTFGTTWDHLTPQIIAQTIDQLIKRTTNYRKQQKAWKKSKDGEEERTLLQRPRDVVTRAIYALVPRKDQKQFYYQLDRIYQGLTDE
jgi:hypothetical protein